LAGVLKTRPKQVIARDEVNVVRQAQNLQRPHKNGNGNYWFASLETADGHSRNPDACSHFGLGDSAPEPCEAQSLT